MADPADLENNARNEEMIANRQQDEARALQDSDNEEDARLADNLLGQSGMLYARAQHARRIANKTRAKLEEIDKKLSDLNNQLSSAEQEKQSLLAEKNYKTPDTLAGEASKLDANAAENEKQAAVFSADPADSYKLSQAENFSAKATGFKEQADQARADADELRTKLHEIDSTIEQLSREISSLEKDRQSMLDDTPRL